MATFHPAGGKTYTLAASISSTQNTILLSSFIEPTSGVPYTMALFNSSIMLGTIGPKTSNSEFISFTGITQNVDGTATLTGVTRGLQKKYPFTNSVTFQLAHSGQTQFILSDMPQVFEQYASLANDETFTGLVTFAQPPVGINPGGQPDASTTVKGVTKISVAPVSATSPISVGDNDGRVPTQGENDALVGTFGTPGSANRFITESNNRTKVITTFYNGSTASGVQNIPHGLGVVPKAVIIKFSKSITPGTSYAECETFYNGTTQISDFKCVVGATNSVAGIALITIWEDLSSNVKQEGTITFDSTNVIITWVKSNSPNANSINEAIFIIY